MELITCKHIISLYIYDLFLCRAIRPISCHIEHGHYFFYPCPNIHVQNMSETVNQYLVHIISPVTDLCSPFRERKRKQVRRILLMAKSQRKNMPDVGESKSRVVLHSNGLAIDRAT